MTLTSIPGTVRRTRPTSSDSTAAIRRGATAYRLPRRFDVHQVERVTAEISALGPGTVSIDGTDVEMIDLSALAALDELTVGTTDLRFETPSVALRATMSYTGHDRLAARCADATFLTAAA